MKEKLLEKANVEIRWNSEVAEFRGAHAKLNSVVVRNNQSGQHEELAADGAFIFIGLDPNSAFLQGTPIRLDRWGFVQTGHDLVHDPAQRPPAYADFDPTLMETSVPGIFAAGDVRAGSTKQVASAAGEGAAVALLMRDYLRTRK